MIKLDRLDKKILNVMQANAKITNLELAERVGLSPTPCARRVKRFEEEGIISRQVTVLNPEALGLNLLVYIGIEMDRHTHDRFAHFEATVKKMPEVLECVIITGQSADLLLKVLVRDMQHYESFLLGQLTHLAGVRGVHSSFVLRKIIDSTHIDLK